MALCNCGKSATRLVLTTSGTGGYSREMCKGCAKKETDTSREVVSRGHAKGVRVWITRIFGNEGTKADYRSK